MAITMTLNLQGIDGESTKIKDLKDPKADDKNMKKVQGKGGAPIDVLSWNWGLVQTASAHVGTSAGVGTADVHDLTITKYVDTVSPALARNCFNGTNNVFAVLCCWMVAGTENIPYVQIKLGGDDPLKDLVYISSINTGGVSTDDKLIETVTFNFNRVEFNIIPMVGNVAQSAKESQTMRIAG